MKAQVSLLVEEDQVSRILQLLKENDIDYEAFFNWTVDH